MALAHADSEQDPQVQSGCKAIMEQALAQMQDLAALQQAQQQALAQAKAPASGKKGQAQAQGDATPSKKVQRAVRGSLEGLYRLCGALQSVMASHAYLQVGCVAGAGFIRLVMG